MHHSSIRTPSIYKSIHPSSIIHPCIHPLTPLTPLLATSSGIPTEREMMPNTRNTPAPQSAVITGSQPGNFCWKNARSVEEMDGDYIIFLEVKRAIYEVKRCYGHCTQHNVSVLYPYVCYNISLAKR